MQSECTLSSQPQEAQVTNMPGCGPCSKLRNDAHKSLLLVYYCQPDMRLSDSNDV